MKERKIQAAGIQRYSIYRSICLCLPARMYFVFVLASHALFFKCADEHLIVAVKLCPGLPFFSPHFGANSIHSTAVGFAIAASEILTGLLLFIFPTFFSHLKRKTEM